MVEHGLGVEEDVPEAGSADVAAVAWDASKADGAITDASQVDSFTSQSSKSTGRHLVILVHGFQASADMMSPLAHEFWLRGAELHICTCNSRWWGTWDGIEAGAQRMAEEVREILQNRSRITFVGHSLGGLYIRCALPLLLEALGSTDVDVCTLATPHEGSPVMKGTLSFVGPTVSQLTRADREHFLVSLAASPYIEALRACSRIIFVGNLNRDPNVPGISACAASGGLEPVAAGLQRVVPARVVDDGPWAPLENIEHLERYAVTWPRRVLASHDLLAGFYGPLHALLPRGAAGGSTVAGQIVELVMATRSCSRL